MDSHGLHMQAGKLNGYPARTLASWSLHFHFRYAEVRDSRRVQRGSQTFSWPRRGSFLVHSRAQGAGRIMAGWEWLSCLGRLLVLGNFFYDRIFSSALSVTLDEKCCVSFSGERVHTSIRFSQVPLA